MANVKINGTTYQAVPRVSIPLADNTGNATFYDTSDATCAQNTVLAGATAYGASGKITGTLTVASVTQDSGTKVLTIS
ncbi:MAG: hypothetical protein IJI45_18295 [Anaerolineaceae bacterium]|nr:hypothetical protein [Anaerolineaceae bacterium]